MREKNDYFKKLLRLDRYILFLLETIETMKKKKKKRKTFKHKWKYFPSLTQYKSTVCLQKTWKVRWNMDVLGEQSVAILHSCWSQAKNDKKIFRLCRELFIFCYQGRGCSQNIPSFWLLLYICFYTVLAH